MIFRVKCDKIVWLYTAQEIINEQKPVICDIWIPGGSTHQTFACMF